MEQKPPSLNTLRLIALGLIGGVCMLGMMMVLIAQFVLKKPMHDLPIITPVYAAVALLTLVLSFVVMPKLAEKQRKAGDDAMKAYTTATLMRMGPLDGGAIIGFIFYLVTNDPVILAVAAVLVAALIAVMPSEQGLARFRGDEPASM